jgi:exodeoxyribonuclease VII large subunit
VQRRPTPLELPFFQTPAPPPVPDAGRGPLEAPAPEAPTVLSVGELDRRLKRLLEGNTADVQVEGEISGLKQVASGHAYFALKDEREDASIDCVMYRTAPARARKLLAEGARIVLVGRATLYAPRGRLQLMADTARPAGRGALLEALERLKEKLAGEGLFAAERKRPLPAAPRVIGVVTSADGAAIHDIVKVAFRRSAVRILLAPAPVQGPDAAERMGRALALLCRVPEVEVIILGRGGGSADDLAAFNDEALVRKVAACRVPVVSAVGHEIDVTLTDLVADARASTPSQAAELIVPDARARADEMAHLRARMARAVAQRVERERAVLGRQTALLGAPERLLGERRQRLDDARGRMAAAVRLRLVARRAESTRLSRRLLGRHPSAVVAGARASLGPLQVRLAAAARRRLASLRGRLGDAAARLDALSPLAVLGRGYAIAVGPSGRAVVDPAELRPGDEVRVRVHRGAFTALVRSSTAESESGLGPRTGEGER